MKKKNLATVMAAAMTLGAVAPVVAHADATTTTVDARIADGYKLNTDKKLVSRTNAYNTNFTADNFSDDTLKDQNAVVVKEFGGVDGKITTKVDNEYVLATKATLTEINLAKAQIAAVNAEIENKLAEKGADGKALYKAVEVAPEAVKIAADPTLFVDSNKQIKIVTVADGTEVAIYNFNGVAVEEAVAEDAILNANYDIDLDAKNVAVKANYAEYNALKFLLEKNATKFDLVKSETYVAGDTNPHADLKIEVYKKGTKTLVSTIIYRNVEDTDKKLVIDMPLSNDFNSHWAKESIEKAMLNGWVDVSATYRPSDNVTRAEFAKIACTVFNIPVVAGQEEPFSDVKSNDWFQKYVAALYNVKVDGQSVVQGSGDELFNPNTEITREESAVIISKLVSGTAKDTKVKVGEDANKKDIMVDLDSLTAFKDDKEIATWADESVNYLNTTEYAAGKVITQGSEGKFMPKSKISRAETLVMMDRAEQAK